MTALLTKRLQWLGWFLAGILAMLLFSSSNLNEQAMTTATSGNSIARPTILQPSQQPPSKQPGVEVMTAAPQSPIFYN